MSQTSARLRNHQEDTATAAGVHPRFALGDRRVAGAVLAVVLGLMSHPSTPHANGAPPTPVFIGPVETRTLVDRVEALGTLRANESVEVTARVTETITRLHFEDGQRVQDGDVLAEMTNAEERAQLEEAKAMLVEAESQLERAKPLAKRGVSSDAVLSERQRNFETAAARLKAVESRIADRTITAPFSGVVGLRRISVGALAEPGTLITTIDDDSVMKLDFTLPATFLSSVKVGLPVVAEAEAFGDKVFRGEISGIDSRVDPVTRSITVRAMLPNPEGVLKAGVLMTVEVLKNERAALVAPENAIVSLGRQNFVYVVDPEAENPKAERRDIVLGAREQGFVEVKEGLAAGEMIVTDGTVRLKPGAPVKIEAVDDNAEPLAKLIEQGAGPAPSINSTTEAGKSRS